MTMKMNGSFDWETAARKWKMPTRCPVCGGQLELNENHTRLSCGNEACKTKLISRVNVWTNILKIKEWAPVTIEKFIDVGLITSLSSIYTMDYSKVAALEGFGERSASILEKNLKKVKSIDLSKFIAGFNIGGIGEKQVAKVIKNFLKTNESVTLETLINAKMEDFICDGIGEKTSDKLYTGIQQLKDEMLSVSKLITIVNPVKQEENTTGKFVGLSFCFTGADPNGNKRPALEAIVIANGGTIASVSKKLSILVASETGTGKAKKAAELGTKVITYDEFLKM